MHSILLSNLVAHSDSTGSVATSCPKLGLLDSAAGTDWPRPQFGFLLWQGGEVQDTSFHQEGDHPHEQRAHSDGPSLGHKLALPTPSLSHFCPLV
jgi:hypothetical protein